MRASARCCVLTDWGISNNDCQNRVSSVSSDGDDDPTSVACSSGYTLFGCTYIGNSQYSVSHLDGGCTSTTTDCNPSQHNSKPIRCVGRDGAAGDGGITSRARCCKSSLSYANSDDIVCIIQYAAEGINNIECPSGYWPMSCNGYGAQNRIIAKSEYVWGTYSYTYNNTI